MFKIYPPNEKYDYPHYKNGLKPWREYPLIDKISLIASIISLIVAYTKG